MGRKRTTGCTARHWPGEPCRACGAYRTLLSRDRAARRRVQERAASEAAAKAQRKHGDAVPTPPTDTMPVAAIAAVDPEREALDKAAAAHRAQLIRAKTYVASYLKRRAIIPPDACERCGISPRVHPGQFSAPEALVPWHPDPLEKRQVAWLCPSCRRHLRATREPIALAWRWPGFPLAAARSRGRPRGEEGVMILPFWISLAQDAAAGITFSTAAADAAFLSAFLQAAGAETAETLYARGARAVAGRAPWAPTGDARLDALLRAWIQNERRERADVEKPRRVTPVPARERIPRRDRLSLLPPPEMFAPIIAEADPAERDARMARALEHLDAANVEADAILARVTAAFQREKTLDTLVKTLE